MLGVDEVEFGGSERERFPVEAAFEQERASGVLGTLEAFLEFVFEALELFRREAAFAGGVDECARGTGGVIEQGLVPFGGLIVDVDGGRRGLDGAIFISLSSTTDIHAYLRWRPPSLFQS